MEQQENKNWWTQRIPIRELKNLAYEWIYDGNEDGTKLLESLYGKKGMLNFAEAGGWNCSDETRRILTLAGYIIFSRGK
jgi:hypothetical protein